MSSRQSKKIKMIFDNIIPPIDNNKFKESEINNNENIDDQEDEHFDQEEELKKFQFNSDIFLEKIYLVFSYIHKLFKFILSVSGVYLLWICLHYFASHLYVKFCVPNTLIGFMMSPFMTATPHCQGLRWVVYNAANMINNMWVVCGSFLCTSIFKINTSPTPHVSS